VGWSCKYELKTSFSDPKIGLKWPKNKMSRNGNGLENEVTMQFCLRAPQGPFTHKVKKKIIF
jgi:hypothetical protein